VVEIPPPPLRVKLRDLLHVTGRLIISNRDIFLCLSDRASL